MTNAHEHPSSQSRPGEIQGEGLLRPQTEAREAPQTNEGRFLELLSPPAEKADELRGQLHEITGQALATTVNPHDQETLMITANIVGWRLFSEPGDPLPLGLVQGRAEDGSLSVRYDTRIGFGVRCAKAAADKLSAAGLKEIDEKLTALMRERSARIKEVFSNTIEASQAHRFINALVSGGLPQLAEERPLTPFWRAIRETQIDQQVRKRWGLEPQEQIIPYTEPDYDLRRELSRVDAETSPRLEKPEADPLSKLRLYFGPLVQAEFTKSCPDKVFIGFERDEDGDRIIRTAGDDYGSDPTDWVQRAARKIALQINETGPHIPVITEEWFYYLVEGALWPNEASQEFAQLSKNAIDEAWKYLNDNIDCGRIFDSEDYHSATSQQGLLHAGLTNPRSPYADLSRLDTGKKDDHTHYSSSRSRAEINTPSEEHIGEVLRFTPNARGQHAHRLIQSEPKHNDLPPLNGDEELVIRLFGKEFKQAQPYIPGYYLVGNAGDVYGFIPDEIGDPYASADIRLTSEQRHILAAHCSEIGLRKLARIVERKSRLTVQGLTSLISEKSAYITSSEAKKLSPPLGSVYLSKLESFREVVRDGSLQVQCTGAAQFLRFSLEAMFGKGTAATTDGYKLSRRTVSKSAKHDQTVFTHRGQTYLLDATPSSTEATTYDDYLFEGIRKRFRRPSFPLAASRMVQIDFRLPTTEEIPDQPESREQKIRTIRQSLEAQLMGLMQVPDRDAVYERVNALPTGDPFRTTIETTLRATYGEATRDEVERLHQYLTAYQEADEVLRRQMGVSSYDDQVVQVLQSAVAQLLGQF